jgi:tetratricopeptide (TPR) repeat protein
MLGVSMESGTAKYAKSFTVAYLWFILFPSSVLGQYAFDVFGGNSMNLEKGLLPRLLIVAAVCTFVFHMGDGATRLQAQEPRPSVAGLSAQCRAADVGSEKAGEFLAKLRALPETLPGLANAITSCADHEKELRRDEDRIWVAALAAKGKWDCADAKRNFGKLQNGDTFYKSQAGIEVRRLGNCGQFKVIDADNPDIALSRAETAFKTGDFGLSRETAWKFVLLSNSVGERARSLLETIEQTENVNRLLSQAQASARTNKNSEACDLLMRIVEDYKSFPSMIEVKSNIATLGCRASRPASTLSTASKRAEFDKNLDAARSQLQRGNLEVAMDYLSAADALIPNDRSCAELKQAIQAAKQFRTKLEKSVSLIYESRNLEALESLKNILADNPTSQALAARAHFYAGVAMAKQFYVFDDTRLLDLAKAEFTLSVNGYPAPDFEALPSKIKELYNLAAKDGATGRTL